MKINLWKTINYVTFFSCLSATIGLSIYSILRYCANEDVTLVHISKYHSSEDKIYPSHSICITPPFLENKFEWSENKRINMSLYIQFLEGKIWDDDMLDIDYDHVTVSLKDNLLKSSYRTQSFERHDWNPVYYTSFRSPTRKCFTIEAPFISNELLWAYWNKINNNIFPNGARSTVNSIKIYLHYPGQRLKSIHTLKDTWESRDNKTKSYRMFFNVKNINVISRRNKANEKCQENWRQFDEFVIHKMAEDAGCIPKYWNLTIKVPFCTNTTQMEKFADQPSPAMVESLNPPCKMIDRLDYSYEEIDEENSGENGT